MSEKWTAKKCRETFVEFFEGKDHLFVPSSGCVPLSDPTILFANAGMNQFKPIFLGQVDPSSDMAKWKRAANSQKCIRAGGKHNDLDDVGKDTYHHTFFEMLGNWSFGDYFKEEAIAFAWELLTKVYGLDPSRIYATYFGGQGDLPADDECKEIWLKYMPASHVIPFDMTDNFWEMGEVGPCGPCTELHYDRIGGRDASSIVNMDDPDVLEIWNIVFMQMNREEDGSLKPLPARHIDTGMGFERILSILQDKRSNYDTDAFMPLFSEIKKVTGTDRDYTGKLGLEDEGAVDTAYRVIADHIRTITFAITDGAMPDKVGRGYVLRRVIRRAVRFGRQCLGAKPGFFCQLVDKVVEMMGDAFPELHSKPDFVKEVIAEEEEQFGRTLDRGIKRFDVIAAEVKAQGGTVVPGPKAFQLYDTFGFPFDLTIMMAEEKAMTVDMDGFHAAMAAQQEQSKGKKGVSKKMVLEAEQTDYLQKAGVEPTDDSSKYTWDQNPTTKVKAIYAEDGFKTSAATGEFDVFGIICESSPFYSEAGGQTFDTGVMLIESEDGDDTVFEIFDCQKFGGFVLHIGELKGGTVQLEANISVRVDYARRRRIAPNHTCTHSVNYALRKVLCANNAKVKIDQRGSLNSPEMLRFDFTYNKALTADELAAVEKIVQADVAKDLKVYIKESPLAQAKAINTLRAVFGEAYPDPVRVVSIGVPVEQLLEDPENPEWLNNSVEFCGGTHVQSLGESKCFVVSKEEAIAKGVRRIYGLTGLRAQQAIAEGAELTKKVADARSLQDAALESAVQELRKDIESRDALSAATQIQLRKSVETLAKRVVEAKKAEAVKITAAVKNVAMLLASDAKKKGTGLLIFKMDDLAGDAKMVKSVIEDLQKEVGDTTVVVGLSVGEGKVLCMVSVPKPLQSKVQAGTVIKGVMPILGGKGGGKPDFAQGQGSSPDGIGAAISQIQEMGSALGTSEVVVASAAPSGPDTKQMAPAEYLSHFKIQENLEEMINQMLTERPENPFAAMADFLGSCSN